MPSRATCRRMRWWTSAASGDGAGTRWSMTTAMRSGSKTPAPISARVSKTRAAKMSCTSARSMSATTNSPAATESRPEARAMMRSASVIAIGCPSSSGAHAAPAADVQGLAGHVRRFVCGEEQYGIADVGRRPHPSRRDGLDEALLHVFGETAEERRVDEGRGDAVGGDPVASHLQRQGAGEADHGSLRCRVVGLSRASQPGARGDVDDPARLLLHHRGSGGAGAQELRLEVHPEYVVPVFLAHLYQPSVAGDPGVVDEDVDPTEGIEGPCDQGRGAGGGRPVRGHAGDRDPGRLQLDPRPVDTVGVQVVDD